MSSRRTVPSYRPDIYSAEAIANPYPHYARLRELGPVVWLPKQRVYALPRYGECKAVLRDDTTFISGRGVALNPLANRLSRGTTLNSDGDDHQKRRTLVAHRLTPRALRTMSDAVTSQAEKVVEAAVASAPSTEGAISPPPCPWPSFPTSSDGHARDATTSSIGPARHSTSSVR